MQKIYFYPSCPREGYTNPYCINYKKALQEHYIVLDSENGVTKMKSATLLHYSLIADIFVLNWIENVASLRLGKIQFVFVLLSLFIIRIRKKKIVWMLHNINPHEGKTWFSDKICNYLFQNASLIISHSIEAANYANSRAKCHVEYICHPIVHHKASNNDFKDDSVEYFDVLIWGSILPYKGVAEFLENCYDKIGSFKVLIIGKCKDNNLIERIETYCSSKIIFENRFADFEELQKLVRNSKYVLFPYIGDSISSSGVLMDTIAMGGTPVGPNKGAFADLQEDHVCFCYNDYSELIEILKSNMYVDISQRDKFLASNSWSAFADKFNNLLKRP